MVITMVTHDRKASSISIHHARSHSGRRNVLPEGGPSAVNGRLTMNFIVAAGNGTHIYQVGRMVVAPASRAMIALDRVTT